MPTDLAALRTVADYQFGAGAGAALFDGVDPDVTYSTGGRPRQIHAPDGRLLSLGTDGRFTLGLAGGRRLHEHLPGDAYRVVVGDESAPFVRAGKNAFAKFVQGVGDEVRPGDEVVVVHATGHPLAVGRAALSAAEMRAFETGMSVAVREGDDD